MDFLPKYKHLDFIITGATGTIGSEVLYELVKSALDGDLKGRIIVLSRSSQKNSATERIANLFCQELIPDYLRDYSLSELLEHIEVFNCDMKNLNGVGSLLRQSSRRAIVIHLASSVNLNCDKSKELDTYYNNYLPTIKLLKIFEPILEKFVFISTAFASGHRKGTIKNEFLKIDIENKDFRNYYEKYKSITERKIAKICEANNITWQILRPSVVCGRLIEKPYFVISRFQVFYLFAYFFHQLIQSGMKSERIRITTNLNRGLNIVPVDFVSKTIVRAVNSNIRELNIVSPNNIPHTFIMTKIFDMLGFENYQFVESIPEDMTTLEELYYTKIGSQFHQYMNTPDHNFDVKPLRQLMKEIFSKNITASFNDIISFAIENDFRNLSEGKKANMDQILESPFVCPASA